MKEQEFIRIAKAEDAKGIAELYNKVYEGKYPLLDFIDSEVVAEHIENKRYIWYICSENKKIIGSSVAEIEFWNNSAELGKTVVDKEYHNKGIAKNLCERVREDTLSRGIDILWGALRNIAMYNISKRDGLTLVGYFPGAHLVNERETHLMGIRLSFSAKQKRIISPFNKIYDLTGIQNIIKEMNLNGKEETYPEENIISAGSDKNMLVTGSYYPSDKSLIINSILGDNFKAPEYIQMTVLIDKTSLIKLLKHLGFKITAFLPGWFLKKEKRYDCVILTNPIITPKIEETLENLIKKLAEGFEN